ncbi:hypothetical protein [Dactylosporangium sp. NPDC048998]|uniref:hypothetical protein n=1 Tax=Dactylosporangium sp. NPDC048998 TaxID=3363976 RepID=UPI00371BDCA8
MDERLGRIAAKLAAAAARWAQYQDAFGVGEHRFRVRAPLGESVVAEFEERHGVRLPEEFRSFLTVIGDGGGGPGYAMPSLADACGRRCEVGHLTTPCPYLPGPRYPNGWAEAHEGPLLGGTLKVADHGCSLETRLIVTGAARGRLFNLDVDGVGPYVVEDPDFLAWYERWLDEVVEGCNVGWFGEKLPGGEQELVAILEGDPSPERRARAAGSIAALPRFGAATRAALVRAARQDQDPRVRAELLAPYRSKRLDVRPVTADQVAAYARSESVRNTVAALEALQTIDQVTVADLLSGLDASDPAVRRVAVDLHFWVRSDAAARHSVAARLERLLDDPDRGIRSAAAAAARHYLAFGDLRPALERRRLIETDRWVRWHIDNALRREPG